MIQSFLCNKLKNNNIDSVILGCTKLPNIIAENITDLNLVDTTQSLAY